MLSLPSNPKLFRPLKVGTMMLQHRAAFGPSTRFRAKEKTHVILPHVKEYYSQRASVPGTLLITEATVIAAKAGGFPNAPGIWSEEQIEAWKEVTDAVHAKGSFIVCQLWAVGRAANYKVLVAEDPSFPYVSASDVPLSTYPDSPPPRPLSVQEIHEYSELHAKAASDAIHKAGFDAVEIHGANGYLLDQFIQDISNKRTDEYGGSIENRCRFPLEVVDAVVKAVGPERTAIRLSPWNTYQDMRMKDPKPTFTHLVTELASRHPTLAYIHALEPRGDLSLLGDQVLPAEVDNDFIRQIWSPRPLVVCGGFARDSAIQNAEEREGEVVAFSRHYIANPDLPYRLKKNVVLNAYRREFFYGPSTEDPQGYTDYPFSEEFLKETNAIKN